MADETFWAHSANKQNKWQSQIEHTDGVTAGAEQNAVALRLVEEARLAALLHDIGKYGDRFQRRLRGQDSGLDHWSAGAWIALTEYQCIAAALAIQGHHIGLQKCDPLSNTFANPGKGTDISPDLRGSWLRRKPQDQAASSRSHPWFCFGWINA